MQDPGPSARISTFEVGPRLGKGGFGEVYHAIMDRPGGLRTEVALKVLHQNLSPRSQAVERLRDEGRVLGLLRHPAIVRVLDLVVLEDRVTLVSEYIEGVDLHAVRGELGPRAATEVIGIIADALAAAYTQTGLDGRPLGLIHRDIKPANIRLGKHGEVKLLDFGIAKAELAERDAETSTGLLLGSVPYLAPERMAGEPIGPPSDVFALGATLWESLVGRRMMGQLTVPDQVRHALDEASYADFLAECMEQVQAPDPVRQLLVDMLARDPALRPTAAEVADRCEAIAQGLDGPGIRAWGRSWTWPERPATEGPLSGSSLNDESDSESVLLDVAESTEAGRGNAGLYIAAGVAAVLGIGAAMLLCAGVGGVVTVQQLLPSDDAGEGGVAVALDPTDAPIDQVDVPTITDTDAGEIAVALASTPETNPPEPSRVVDEPPPSRPPATTSPDSAPPPVEPGRIVVRGRAIPEIRQGSKSMSPGEVAAGTYTLWYDFGEGLKQAGTVTVAPGETVTVQCNSLRYDCSRR